MNENDELYHFGIPGMKWGRRRGPQTSMGRTKNPTQKGPLRKNTLDPKDTKAKVLKAKGKTASEVDSSKSIKAKDMAIVMGSILVASVVGQMVNNAALNYVLDNM